MARAYYPACRAILQVVFDTFGPDDDPDPVVIPVLPKTATVHRNSYRQADSYEITFDAGDLPFDPRIIRTGFAEIYLYQTDGQEGDTKVLSRKDPLATVDSSSGRPRTIVDTLSLDVGLSSSRDRFTLANKPLIAGLFDSSSLELSGDGKWVALSGQDLTAHLASLQWKPNPNGTARRIPVGKRIDALFAELLEEADPTGRIGLDVRGLTDAELPMVGAGEVRGSARGIPVEQNTTYWDVFYKMATRYGLITYVDGVDVVLTRPKTIDSQTTNLKRLVWGTNVEHLTLERHLGKIQSPTIVVESYDDKAKKTISVEYPTGQIDHARAPAKSQTKVRGTETRAKTTERHRAKAVAHHKGKTATTLRKRDEYEIVTVHGITDRKTLEQIAENTYHLVGKGERRVIAKTRDLLDGSDTPSDMLQLGAGDAVGVDWDEFNRELLSNTKLPDETKIAHLIDRGFNRSVAQVIVSRYADLPGLDRPLRVHAATYSFDADEGIDIELELYDFIVIDGIRSDSGASREPRGPAHRARMIKHDGQPLGISEDQRDAMKTRYRP